MSLVSPTAALVNLQDTSGATVAQANGQISGITPNALANFSLQSTLGVQVWEITFQCLNFPALHGKTFAWKSGQANLIQVPIPAEFVGTYTSSVSDGQQSIVQVSGGLYARGATAVPRQFGARLVAIAALAAYTNVGGTLTMNANGALANIDGVAPAVGDFILLPPGIAAAAADVGIYQVVSLGGAAAKPVLALAPDWPLGGPVMNGAEIRIEEGTVYAGVTWVVTNTGTSVIGTTTFTMFPRSVTQSLTLVAGTVTIANVPVLSATKTMVVSERTTANTTAATVAYATIGGKTAGALGTATLAYQAAVAAGTINNADVSTLAVTVVNPC